MLERKEKGIRGNVGGKKSRFTRSQKPIEIITIEIRLRNKWAAS